MTPSNVGTMTGRPSFRLMSSEPEARYDAYARWYDQWIADPDADFVALSLLRVVGAHTDERILDLGCGQGRLARKLAEAGNEVVAVDLSERSRDWWDGTQFDAVGFALEAVEEPPWASPPDRGAAETTDSSRRVARE
jgi:SAM-dependent methyltransferase